MTDVLVATVTVARITLAGPVRAGVCIVIVAPKFIAIVVVVVVAWTPNADDYVVEAGVRRG